MTKRKSMKGFTIMLAFGSWGGIKGYIGAHSVRICLGFVALTIIFRDFENVIEICLDNKDAKIKELEEMIFNHSPNTGN